MQSLMQSLLQLEERISVIEYRMKTKQINTIIGLLIALWLVLSQYTVISGVSLSSLLIFLVCLYIEVRYNHFKFFFDTIEKALGSLYLFLSCFSFFSFVIFSHFEIASYISRVINMFLTVYFLYMARRYMDTKFAIKCMKIVSIFASLVMLYQLFVDPYFTFYLPLSHEHSVGSGLIEDTVYFIRPNSIFSEPSKYGLYISITIFLMLFYQDNKRKSDYFTILFLSICVLISSSATGIGLTGIVFVYYLLTREGKVGFKVVGIIAILVLFFSPLRSLLLYGYSRINLSGQSRILGWISMFKQFDSTGMLFGCGIGNFAYVFKNETSLTTFLSSIGRVFIESGILGGSAFCIAMISIIRHVKKSNIILIFLVTCLFEEVFFGGAILVFFSFLDNPNCSKTRVGFR